MVQTLEEGINPNVGDINQKDKLIEKFDSMNVMCGTEIRKIKINC